MNIEWGDFMVKGIVNEQKNIYAYKQKWIESGDISWSKGLRTKNMNTYNFNEKGVCEQKYQMLTK